MEYFPTYAPCCTQLPLLQVIYGHCLLQQHREHHKNKISGQILLWNHPVQQYDPIILNGNHPQTARDGTVPSFSFLQTAGATWRLVCHHHQHHEHHHHLHDHHQQHHKGWVRFLTMQHQTVTPPQTSTIMNLSSGERRCPCLSSPWSSWLSTSTWCRTIPARWSPDRKHRPEGSTLVLPKPWSFTTHPSSGVRWRHSSRYSSLHHTLPSSSPGSL